MTIQSSLLAHASLIKLRQARLADAGREGASWINHVTCVGPVLITRHRAHKAVLISIGHLDRLLTVEGERTDGFRLRRSSGIPLQELGAHLPLEEAVGVSVHRQAAAIAVSPASMIALLAETPDEEPLTAIRDHALRTALKER